MWSILYCIWGGRQIWKHREKSTDSSASSSYYVYEKKIVFLCKNNSLWIYLFNTKIIWFLCYCTLKWIHKYVYLICFVYIYLGIRFQIMFTQKANHKEHYHFLSMFFGLFYDSNNTEFNYVMEFTHRRRLIIIFCVKRL